jgi:AhpD family alkylhydroperoxidase
MHPSERRKIEDIIRVRKLAHSYYSRRSEAYRSFMELEAATFADGALPRRQKELIATGISVVLDCESCMEWHVREALRSGATQDEIVEAIGVAIEIGGGRATVSARFAASVLEYHAEAGATGS